MLFPLRFGYSELRDHFRRWWEARRPHPVVDYDPDKDLCGQFAEALRRNGFEEQADAVWKLGTSDRWEDHSQAFAEAVIKSGDKEAARVGAKLLADCLDQFASAMSGGAIGLVHLDIHDLLAFIERPDSVGDNHESGQDFR